MEVDGESQEAKSQKASFALDVDVPTGSSGEAPEDAQKDKDKDAPDPKLDGIIGRLEIYRSGVVKMRIGNDIVLDVSTDLFELPPCRSLLIVLLFRSQQRPSRLSCNTRSTSTCLTSGSTFSAKSTSALSSPLTLMHCCAPWSWQTKQLSLPNLGSRS
jgi:hypothetical protein